MDGNRIYEDLRNAQEIMTRRRIERCLNIDWQVDYEDAYRLAGFPYPYDPWSYLSVNNGDNPPVKVEYASYEDFQRGAKKGFTDLFLVTYKNTAQCLYGYKSGDYYHLYYYTKPLSFYND